jgi:hypothetical protein
VNSVLYPIAAVTAWLACLYKARDLRRPWDAPLAAIVGAFVCLGGIFFVATPRVWLALDEVAHYPNLAILISQALVMPYTFCVLSACLLWRYRLDRARKLIHRYGIALTIVVSVMAILFFAAPHSTEDPTMFVPHNARNLYINVYLMVYITTYAVLQIAVVRLTLQLAQVGGRPWLRRGLRINAFGNLFTLPYCMVRLGDVAQRWTDFNAAPFENVARLSVGIGVLLPPIGCTIPRWGPRLAHITDWAHAHGPYWRLHPLWDALTAAAPHVVLDTRAPWGLPVGRGRLAVRASYRLARRYVEIRDARLELQSFLDPEVRAVAEQAARQAGIDGLEFQAVVEAARIAAALRVRTSGAVTHPASAQTLPDAEETGADLSGVDAATEILWLTRVADAFTRSPVVASVMANTDPGPGVREAARSRAVPHRSR